VVRDVGEKRETSSRNRRGMGLGLFLAKGEGGASRTRLKHFLKRKYGQKRRQACGGEGKVLLLSGGNDWRGGSEGCQL